MWYVCIDPQDGPYITQFPADDEVVFRSESQTEAEIALSRECNGWEDTVDDMNESFR